MRKKLYTPGTSFDIAPSSLSARASKLPHAWEPPPERPAAKKRKLSGSAIFLIGAAAFFVIAGLVAFFLVIQGGRSVSNDRVKITIENPPTSIAGGDTVSLYIVIKNENPAILNDAKLFIDFPAGTYSATEPPEPLAHQIEALGDIAPGAIKEQTVRATLYGEANQKIVIPVKIEYRTDGSTSVFEKTEEFEFTIGTSPVSVNVVALDEVSSGQEMKFEISVRSNAPAPIENLAVRAEYPFGFSPTDFSPEPAVGRLFKLGTLAPGEEKKITITGTLAGQDKDERVFKFSAGTARPDGSPNLAVSFITKEAFVAITRPFIAVGLTLDRTDADTVVARPGVPMQAMLAWTNTLTSQIQDAELTVRIQGAALDKSSVTTLGGFYRSSDTTVLFNRDTNSGLRTLQPGDNGNGSFSFSTKPASELASMHNPSLTITVSVAGRRVGESGVSERITSTLTRTVQVASEVSLSASATRSSGPYPAEPDTETVYSVRWNVANGVNAIADTVVKATLPYYVRFVSSNNGVMYNESTREVSWSVGEVGAHASVQSASFQVAFLPSSSQSGSSPAIVSAATLTGFDRYVQKTLTDSVPAIDSGQPVK